jgi:uncharacterized RDD family membrane protein YckC
MSTCEKCTGSLPKGYLLCPSCGHKAGSAVSIGPAQGPLNQPPKTQAPQTLPPRLQVGAQYAGFWVRFAAHLIDVIILWAVLGTLYIFFSLAAGEAGSVVALSLYALISLFYEGYFLSRNWFATPGKKAMKLQVLDESHQHISFGVAMGRSLLKFVSAITFGIGYLMVAFTDKKQGLHDFMVKTVVIRV